MMIGEDIPAIIGKCYRFFNRSLRITKEGEFDRFTCLSTGGNNHEWTREGTDMRTIAIGTVATIG